jgi:hypothetical protein
MLFQTKFKIHRASGVIGSITALQDVHVTHDS